MLVAGLATAVVSAWMIVASEVFSQSTVQNLTLADSLAIGGLALVALIAHELGTESVIDSLRVTADQRDSGLDVTAEQGQSGPTAA